jgi:hypothetical protein
MCHGVCSSVLTLVFFPFLFLPPCLVTVGPILVHRYGSDVVSKVTLPAWPGQGYGCHRLSSGLLGPFILLSVLGYYLLYVWFGSLYVYLDILTHGVFVVILYIILWVPSWTCVMLLLDSTRITCTLQRARDVWWCVSKATSYRVWCDRYNLQGADFGASQVVSEPRFCRYPWVQSACRITLPTDVVEFSV